MTENRVIEKRMALLLDFLRRVDVDNGRQRSTSRIAVGPNGSTPVIFAGWRFLQGNNGLLVR
jgi:hypothetical protein